MTLDSWLAARLARELDGMLTGARVSGLRATDRRLTLACYRRGEHVQLLVVLDPQAPLVALTRQGVQANESGPGGWAGGVAPLLGGSVVDAVRAVPDDRILNVDLSSRSAFGVPARHRLVLELEGRRGNALVLRPIGADGWSIIAAARQILGDENHRTIAVGEPYEPPPPREATLDHSGFIAAATVAVAQADPERRALARQLCEVDPACTPPLAREVVERVLEAHDGRDPGDAMLETWRELREQVTRACADLEQPLYAYRRGDEIVACHVVPLSWAAGEMTTAKTLNELCAHEIARAERIAAAPAGAALRKKLERMLKRCADEMQRLRSAQERASSADALREIGDAIYANLAAIPMGADAYTTADGMRIALNPLLTPKQNAADYFKRYKKARTGLPQINARLERLAINQRVWEQLLWELERAQADPSLRAAIYEDVTAAISKTSVVPASRVRVRPKSRAQERGTTSVALPGGAVAFVGRSPKDNERITFSVARPDDYWFHARGIPGAHVILKLAHAGDAPTQEQLVAAAQLAAGASRASDAAKVEVDYTQRKHVRRQGKGGTGLVWYTDAKTILASPTRG
jgi:predicted ribosome quality control (RQC) complex YloA/Tae2 family protein